MASGTLILADTVEGLDAGEDLPQRAQISEGSEVQGRRGARHVRPSLSDLLKLPQTWGTIFSKTLTDPVFFFIADWFPIYLVAKGISLKSGLIAIWIPFIATDVGNFIGGWFSGYLIKRGWSRGARRGKRWSCLAGLE